MTGDQGVGKSRGIELKSCCGPSQTPSPHSPCISVFCFFFFTFKLNNFIFEDDEVKYKEKLDISSVE